MLRSVLPLCVLVVSAAPWGTEQTLSEWHFYSHPRPRLSSLHLLSLSTCLTRGRCDRRLSLPPYLTRRIMDRRTLVVRISTSLPTMAMPHTWFSTLPPSFPCL